jgi:hypothetical protein
VRKFLKECFRLRDLKYGWMLLVSFILFAASFFIDRHVDPEDQTLLEIAYYLAFAVAVLWGVCNYMAHVRVHALYQKHGDIRSFVDQLALDREERLELRNYLEDYAQDLMDQGRSRKEAMEEAIRQFQVKELMTLSKNSPVFRFPAHHYLFGFAAWTFLLAVLLNGVRGAVSHPESLVVALMVVQYTLVAYGLGLVGMFGVYKLIDAIIDKKTDGNAPVR